MWKKDHKKEIFYNLKVKTNDNRSSGYFLNFAQTFGWQKDFSEKKLKREAISDATGEVRKKQSWTILNEFFFSNLAYVSARENKTMQELTNFLSENQKRQEFLHRMIVNFSLLLLETFPENETKIDKED